MSLNGAATTQSMWLGSVIFFASGLFGMAWAATTARPDDRICVPAGGRPPRAARTAATSERGDDHSRQQRQHERGRRRSQ